MLHANNSHLRQQDYSLTNSPFEAPIARLNWYEETDAFSSQVLYCQEAPVITQRFRHDPYALFSRQLLLKVFNLPFVRGEHAERDLRMLFKFITQHIIPEHLQEQRGNEDGQAELTQGLCPSAHLFARVVGMKSRVDRIYGQDGHPSKSRHVIIETNYPFLSELLRDHRLYILGDLQCFHVCWDGKSFLVANDGSRCDATMTKITHNVKAMHDFCKNLRTLALPERYQATKGLPCSAVKFDCLGIT